MSEEAKQVYFVVKSKDEYNRPHRWRCRTLKEAEMMVADYVRWKPQIIQVTEEVIYQEGA